MSEDESLQIIRETLAPAQILRIVVDYDPDLKKNIVKVYVNEDQHDLAVGVDGFKARRAAIESAMDIEVILTD